MRACLGHLEVALRDQGFERVAGVDEAGRGALAGPLVAAAVVVPPDFDPEGINDSKLLTRRQREAAFGRITASCEVAVRKIEPGVLDSAVCIDPTSRCSAGACARSTPSRTTSSPTGSRSLGSPARRSA